MSKQSKALKSTLLDFAILGLLQEIPRSGYNIRKVFEMTALGLYSSSPGSIYPALDRLQNNDLVVKRQLKESNKNRFHITRQGVGVLKSWLLKELHKVDVERNRDELLLRFAFMENLLTVEQKLYFLRSFQDLLGVYLKELKTYHKSEAHNLPLHGRLSFEHGIETCKTTIAWCKKAIRIFADQT